MRLICAPTDLTKIADFPSTINHAAPDSPEARLIGGPIAANPQACKRANPIAYIDPNDPPFLIVHGDKDTTVPLNQSQLLYDALKKVGVPATFYIVPGGGHGFQNPKVNTMVEEFFDQHLKPASPPRPSRL